MWSVDSIVKVSRLGSIKVERNDALVTFDEKSDSTDVYFRTVVPEQKREEATFTLADFFSRRYNVVFEDNNLLNHLLRAPVDGLADIMLNNNRFLPEERHHHQESTEDCELVEMDVDSADVSEKQESEHIHRPSNPPSTPTHYSLRELVPSIDSRSQTVVRSAWNFRISKRFNQVGAAQVRARKERLQPSLFAMKSSISTMPATPIQEGFQDSTVFTRERPGSPPELTVRSTAHQVRTREIGSLGELFVRHFGFKFILTSNFCLIDSHTT